MRVLETERNLREAVKLSKHGINNHTIQTSPSFWRGEVKQYGWIPSHLHITPEQERAIQELVKDGTYTDDDAKEVRDQMLFEKQREIIGLDNTKR